MADGAPRIRGFNYLGRHRYALTICVHLRRPVFMDSELVARVLDEIRRAAVKEGFDVNVFCFMPDHVHLLVEGLSDEANLTRFVKSWKQRTGFEYSQRTGMHLWQVGFFDHVLRSEESLQKHALYILGNPIRAGLSRTLGEYPFAGGSLAGSLHASGSETPPET